MINVKNNIYISYIEFLIFSIKITNLIKKIVFL